MFNQDLISKNLFNEATNQIQRFLSSSTIADLNKENKEKPVGEKTYAAMGFSFLKNFLKMYGIRLIFSSVGLLKKKNLLSNLLLNIYNVAFNKGSLKTCLFVSSIPFINELNHKLFKDYVDVNTIFFTFFSGFISAFIGISFEDHTELVKFIILSLLARTCHSLLTLLAIKTNNPPQSKFYSYLGLLTICTLFNIMNY